ncbi:MAG TPA: AAA family ATPase [Acidimicrobiia bacterium]
MVSRPLADYATPTKLLTRRAPGPIRQAGVASAAVNEPSSLVEREEQLASLRSQVVDPANSNGVVLLSGEAGFGKTSLLKAFVATLDHRYRILEAACEPVGIPTAFAPLFDLFDELPNELRDDVRVGSGRAAVYAGMVELLKGDRVVLIIEDAQWSDEATLGLIRYLGRRIASTKSLLIVTYRSEELDLAHPLHLVVADLGPFATEIELPALSPSGVQEMMQGLDLDPKRVHSATLGNPFLVEEVIRHPESKLPATISNAVLARAANLSPEARETLYLVALCPDGAALDLLLESNPAAGSYVDLAVQRRLLASSMGHVTCRHELVRASLVSAVPPALKCDLHRRWLGMLEHRAGDSADISTLAYHSIGSFDSEKAVRYSLEAAKSASRGGAHRQAAEHYANALRYREQMTPDELERTLLEAAHEHCLMNDFGEACRFAGELVEVTGDRVDHARALSWLSYFESRENDLIAAQRTAELAIFDLQEEPASEELALATAVIAWVSMVEGALPDAIDHASEAVAMARAAGSTRVEVHAATTLGTCQIQLGDATGLEIIEAAVRLGLEKGSDEWTARSMNNLGLSFIWSQDLIAARERFASLVEYTAARELDAWYIAALTTLASIDVRLGRWEEADRGLATVLGQKTCRQTEAEALITAAKLSARRGAPESELMIESLIDRAQESRDYDIVVNTALLGMEAAWLDVIDASEALGIYGRALEFGTDDPWSRGMLAFWALRIGANPPEGEIPAPSGLELNGQMAEAAEEWRRTGNVLEAAICEALVPDADLDPIFARLSKLGADSTSKALRRELHRRGVKGIPRGERASTRQNPAGLTDRQVEVFSLMQAGLSNAVIAEKLFISEKTAGHHVSAILAKLNARSRLHAVAMASAGGWGDPPSPLSNE